MGAFSKRSIRRTLAAHPFLTLLLHDVWFRLGIIAFMALVIFLGVFLPPIWTTSPPGFRPVVRVSGLELAQAWSLKQSAKKGAKAGRFEDADYAWKAALAKNPADADLVRGFLNNKLLSGGTETLRRPSAVSHGFWLLRLTDTNANDLELVGRILDAEGRSELFIALADSHGERTKLTPSLEAMYLKALFQAGRFAAFGNRWERIAAELPHDEALHLYRSAFLAGMGNDEARKRGWQALQDAQRNPRHGALASRLVLSACLQRREADSYGQALQRLKECGAATLSDQVGFWRVLAWDGRKKEALALAETESKRPASPQEVIELAQLYSEWGLREPKLQLFRKYATAFSYSAEFWVAYAGELIEARIWDELRQLSLRARLQPDVHDELIAFSYYLEGRAELGQARHFHAEAAFRKVGQREFAHPRLGLKIARDLIALGRSGIACTVLRPLEKDLASNAEFWSLLFEAAENVKDTDLMLRAAREAFRLQPNEPTFENNYAACLLIQRQTPEEAVRLTFKGLARRPSSPSARVNHAGALILNNRVEEALAILQSVNPDRLPKVRRAVFHLDRFEACLRLERFDEARYASDLIEAQCLYAPQVQWLEENRRKLPPMSLAQNGAE